MSLEQSEIPTGTDSATQNDTISEKVQEITSFAGFGLRPELLKGIEQAGFTAPSPIQVSAVPVVLRGQDMIGQAQTGSGKTAAFVIPALQKLKVGGGAQVLVLVPTRELSKQVVKEVERLGRGMRIRAVSVVGGEAAYRQIEGINRGAEVVVATPGRMLDHLRSKVLKSFAPRLVVLDEADEMLDMGFIDDIRKILECTPSDRQTLLFSATMPGPIARLAQEHLTNPERISLVSKKHSHADIEQTLFVVKPREREDTLIRLMDSEKPHKAVVFCRTRKDTSDIWERLVKAGIKAQPLHGDLSQNERNRAISQIKNGVSNVLVATDVASRGLDIPDLSHVFNFHVPENLERYTHRIGRTGRAGNKGKALTFASPSEFKANSYLHSKEEDGQKIKYCEVPNKRQVAEDSQKRFFETLSQVEVSAEVSELCAQLVPEEKTREMLEKLYTWISRGQTITGPEILGFSVSEIVKMQKRPRVSSRRGGNYGGPRGGGGFRRGGGGGGGGRFKSSNPRFKKKSRS